MSAALPRTPAAIADRRGTLERATRLELLTVGWNLVEGVIAVAAGLGAGSTALLAFGIDSFVESLSGSILLWRLIYERRSRSHEALERIEERARKLVAVSLFLLAAWVCWDALATLWTRERPEPSYVGIALTLISMAVMLWLARAKRRVASDLGSRALAADAFQTTACFWLSVITLSGIGINALFGWWWADPVAALAMVWFIGSEARGAWRGEDCCGGSCRQGSLPTHD